jgi:hypothetical protein
VVRWRLWSRGFTCVCTGVGWGREPTSAKAAMPPALVSSRAMVSSKAFTCHAYARDAWQTISGSASNTAPVSVSQATAAKKTTSGSWHVTSPL